MEEEEPVPPSGEVGTAGFGVAVGAGRGVGLGLVVGQGGVGGVGLRVGTGELRGVGSGRGGARAPVRVVAAAMGAAGASG